MGACCSHLLDCFPRRDGYSQIPDLKSSTLQLSVFPVVTTEPVNCAGHRKTLRGKQESYSESVLEQYNHEPQQIVQGLPREFSKLYELGQLLGVGTTSKVYQIMLKKRKALTKQGVHRELACKIIDKRKLTLGMDREDVEPLLMQLRKEVDILRRISHPNIVSFQDFVESKALLFIITEYLPGGELFEYILKNGPLPEVQASRALYGVFSAVSYLHDRGVIHRDIKAENVIFFQKVNGDLSLKLIDFGFSTILKHDLTGSFLGTGGYIAPEIRQNKHYSMSVDNWALGVLIYCTLSAKLPFAVSVDILPNTRSECDNAFRLRFPERQWASISEEAKDLVRQLLNIDPFIRITAKESMQHAWFRSARSSKKHRSFRASTAESGLDKEGNKILTQTDSFFSNRTTVESQSRPKTPRDHDSSDEDYSESSDFDTDEDRRQNRHRRSHHRLSGELPSLQNKLRRVQSLIQLERRKLTGTLRGEPLLSPRTQSGVTSSGSNEHSQYDYLVGDAFTQYQQHQHFTDQSVASDRNAPRGPSQPPIAIPPPQTLLPPSPPHSSQPQESSPPTEDLIHSRSVQDDSKLPSLVFTHPSSHLRAVSVGSHSSPHLPVPSSPRPREHSRSAQDLASAASLCENVLRTSSLQPMLPFIIESMHDHMAGDLFYATYNPAYYLRH